MITQEQFSEWKTHPVTQEIFSELQKVREELIDKVAYGSTLSDTAERTHGLTNRMIGHIEGINQLLNISFAGEEVIDDISMLSGY